MSGDVTDHAAVGDVWASATRRSMPDATDGEKYKPLDLVQLPLYLPRKPLEQRACAAGGQAAGHSSHV